MDKKLLQKIGNHNIHWIDIGLGGLIFFILVCAVYVLFPLSANCDSLEKNAFTIGLDFICAYRPAVYRFFAGQSPYGYNFFNPPWVLIPLLPIALLPVKWGVAVMFVAGLFGYGIAGYRVGWKPWATLAMLFSQPVYWNYRLENLDWLVALGFTLPPQIGLFFILLKPNLSWPIAVFWLIDAWHKGRLKEVIRIFAPIGIAYVISFLVYGPYLLNAVPFVDNQYNYSIWPNGVVIGLVLLASAISENKEHLARIAGPFLSPYVTIQAWSIGLFGLSDVGVVIASIALWFFPMGAK